MEQMYRRVGKSYKLGQRKKPSKAIKILMVGLPMLGILVGGYILLLILTTQLGVSTYQPPDAEKDAELISRLYPEGDYLEIEKLNLVVPIGRSEDALQFGSWMRYPADRNPEVGGNTILTGHRFQMGYTPRGIANKSPFYEIDKLGIGDEILVHYNGEDYTYRIEKKYSVKPTATEIESNSQEHKITLYTCTLGGAADGRVVIEARPV